MDVVSGKFYSFHAYTVCHSIVKDIDIGHNFIDDAMKCLKEGYGKVLDDTQMHPSFCLFVRELWICLYIGCGFKSVGVWGSGPL